MKLAKKQKKQLIRILTALVLFIPAWILLEISFLERLGVSNRLAYIPLFLIPYIAVGSHVLKKAVLNISHGQVFDENFLMMIATLGAFAVGEYPEAVAVMLFYQVGEFFESCAVSKSRRSISALMDIRPDHANVIRGEGSETETVSPGEVAVGEYIIVKPGEKIPLDSTVIEGYSGVNTAALTGESVPAYVSVGDAVISGCINMSGALKLRVDKGFGDSTVSKILELVENSSANKSRSENFITRFARYYTPAVVMGALVLAFIPPIFTGDYFANFSEWFFRALIFLVISCPCALVISVPLSFFGGIGGASAKGILVKGGNYLEALANCEIAVFDKTGTLTNGSFEVTDVHPEGISADELLEIAAYAECFSEHPISVSIKKAYGKQIIKDDVRDIEDMPGYGIKAEVKGNTVYVGNANLMDKIGADITGCVHFGTVIHVCVNGEYAGHICVADTVKPDALRAVSDLKKCGVKKVVMLTGDREDVGREVSSKVGIDEYHAELMPADKVCHVEKLISERSEKGKLVFVGDGINDAPVLARADVGIAMGGIGSDAAIEAADIVIMDDDPSKVALAVKIARKTNAIVRQNIWFALSVKAIMLLLGAIGYANMWAAVFADVGVSVLAILNSMRTLKFGKNN